MAVTDPASLIYEYLHDSAVAKAVAVRATLISGAASVLKMGQLDEDVFGAAEDLRASAAANWHKTIAIVVQDGGEYPDVPGTWRSPIVVRIVDRGIGYDNIAATRIEACRAIGGIIGNVITGYGGVLQVTYLGRVGQRYDKDWGAQYDALTFEVTYESNQY